MLNRIFLEQLGATATAFLKDEQIEIAKTLLRERPLSITEIAYCAGFGTRRTLYRAFKRSTGLTPDEYRRSRQNVSRH